MSIASLYRFCSISRSCRKRPKTDTKSKSQAYFKRRPPLVNAVSPMNLELIRQFVSLQIISNFHKTMGVNSFLLVKSLLG